MGQRNGPDIAAFQATDAYTSRDGPPPNGVRIGRTVGRTRMNFFISAIVGGVLASVAVIGGVGTYSATQSTSAPDISSVNYADE